MIEVSVICDECGALMAQGPTPGAARSDVLGTRALLRQPGGEDLCGRCVIAMDGNRGMAKRIRRRQERKAAAAG